jgi:hypothetical protein
MLLASVMAAPTPDEHPHALLFPKDPMAIHKRDVIPVDPLPVARAEVERAEAESAARPARRGKVIKRQPAADFLAPPAEDSCASVCGVTRVEGARSEREALCSVDGLRATFDCAECIDATWPDTTWEDSALAEYERIVAACEEAPPQKVFRDPTEDI